MTSAHRIRRIIGNVLIVVGVLVLLAGCSLFVRQQVEGQQLRAGLQSTPATAPTEAPAAATVAPTPVAASPTPIAQPTVVPTPIASPTALPSATPAPTATAPTANPAPAGNATPDLPVRIVIPDLKLDAPVVEMGWTIVNTAAGPQSDWVIPKNAAGHHINSAALNENGNIVISGHNNIEGKVFEAISLAWDEKTRVRVDDITDRSDILKGRKIVLYNAAGKAFEYTVSDFLRLKDAGASQAQRLQNARFMDPTPERRLTLITCWPPWSNTHRLIVIAAPAQP
ncbi:MAG: sortase [Anaerolineae bacterium]|nr:sortase [Anaerolineae bacterium]